ncbi:MAG: DUF4411 family protein [bacterium]|nr:DUF4411 family protein [bacterium]
MIYVFDSDAFINLFKHFYLNRFPSLWEKFNQLVKEGVIISVREVYNEIGEYGDRLSQWANDNRHLFQQPSPEENLPLSLKYSKFLIFSILFASRSVYRVNLLLIRL